MVEDIREACGQFMDISRHFKGTVFSNRIHVFSINRLSARAVKREDVSFEMKLLTSVSYRNIKKTKYSSYKTCLALILATSGIKTIIYFFYVILIF